MPTPSPPPKRRHKLWTIDHEKLANTGGQGGGGGGGSTELAFKHETQDMAWMMVGQHTYDASLQPDTDLYFCAAAQVVGTEIEGEVQLWDLEHQMQRALLTFASGTPTVKEALLTLPSESVLLEVRIRVSVGVGWMILGGAWLEAREKA